MTGGASTRPRRVRGDAGDGPPPGRAAAAGALLVVGAFGVVLAGVSSDVFDLERYLLPKALVLHVTALAVLLLGFPSLERRRWGTAEWLLLAFVVWSAASAALATNRWLAAEGWAVSFSSLVLYLASRELAPRLRWRILPGVLAAAVLGAALGVAQAYGADWEWLATGRPPGGTFGNRNFLAHLSALAVPPVAIVALRSRRWRWLLPSAAALAVLAAAIVLTRSRAAWLGGGGGVIATLVVLVVARRRTRATSPILRSLLLAAALAAAVGLAVLLPNRLDWRSGSPYAATLTRLADYREGSGRGRIIQYRNSLALVPARPVLGVGPGNWLVHYPRVTTPGDPAYSGHLLIPTNPWPSSDWVALVAERGLVGALLLLLAGAVAAGRALANAAAGEPDDAWAGAAFVGTVVTALVTGSFDAVLLLPAPSFLVWTVAGLMVPPARRPLGAEWGKGARRTARGSAVLASLALVALTATHTAAVAVTDDSDRRTLERAARLAPGEHRLRLLLAERGRCAHAARAAELMPHHPRVRELAERCGG